MIFVLGSIVGGLVAHLAGEFVRPGPPQGATGADWTQDGITMMGAGSRMSRASGAEGSVNVATAAYFHDRQGCSWLYGGVTFQRGEQWVSSSVAAARQDTSRAGVGTVLFVGAVKASDGESTATAAAMWADSKGSYVLRGRPARIVRGGSEIVGNTMIHRAGELHLPSGVWARVADVRLPGGGQHPVHVEAAQGVVDRATGTWAFEGGVRSWSARDLLTAEAVEVTQTGELDAVGDVHLSIRDPVELNVRADAMHWSGTRAVFAGDVQAAGRGRTARCDELAVDVVDGRVVRFDCRGVDVRVEDRESDHRVSGASRFAWDERAVVEIEGCPARIEQPGERPGDVLEAAHVLHDLETGLTVVRSGM